MKRRWTARAFFLAALLATPAWADTTIVVVRHGEKPDRGFGQLNCQGLNRSLALPEVLAAKFGRPDAIYAPDPGVAAEDFGQPYNYIRPLATIEPTAIRFGLPVHTAWGLADLAPLEDELLNRAHDGQLIFVAWEHTLAVQAVRDMVARRGGDPKRVPDWARDDFDSIYVVTVPRTGKPSFRIEHEGLDGLSTSCPGHAEPPLPGRALIGVADVDAAIRDETELNQRADCLSSAAAPWFLLDDGDAPIVVTAPHVTRPFRQGAYRFEDGGGTGALARAFHRLTGAPALYTVDASPSDPNFYDDNDFKTALAGLLERRKPSLLLDIHASHSHRPYDVDLGTMDGASLLGQAALRRDLVDILHEEGIANVSLDFFSAKQSQTITKFASTRGVPAIQLEINSTWLHPAANDLAAHRFAQLLQALLRYARREQPGLVAAPNAAVPPDLSARACASRVPAK
jgi:hypothetical protein